jgi:antitoxin PrlF
MRHSTLTSKGQVTIPKEIRELLKVESGDRIDFVIDPTGNVVVHAGTVHLGDLKGILHRPGRKAVSIEEMDQAVRRRHGRHP